MSIRQRLLRLVKSAAAITTFIVLAGATYQGISTAIERREFRRPGGLVSIGDHQLHIHCTGAAHPTVVLEAPALGMSAAWSRLAGMLPVELRVCRYDRAGLGWSEASDAPYDAGRVPDELYRLLHAAGQPGPYVLVGQGLGAAFARVFASRYSEETRAVVVVDPPDEHRADRRVLRIVQAAPWLARAGILRLTGTLADRAGGLPDGAMRAFLNRPDHLTRGAEELEHWHQAVSLAASSPVPPHVPVRTVIASGPDPLALLATSDEARIVAAAIVEVLGGLGGPR